VARKLSQEHGSERLAPSLLLSQEEAAEFLGLSPSTLSSWRVEGRGPKFIRISGRAVRYRAGDLEIFISEREVQPSRIASPTPNGGLGQLLERIERRTPVESAISTHVNRAGGGDDRELASNTTATESRVRDGRSS
jgi:predicted DNA-binding transcriptional regulator AlpA